MLRVWLRVWLRYERDGSLGGRRTALCKICFQSFTSLQKVVVGVIGPIRSDVFSDSPNTVDEMADARRYVDQCWALDGVELVYARLGLEELLSDL